MAKKSTLRLGLIGSGFMGKTHAFGFAAAARVFDLPYEVEMGTLADVSKPQAEAAASALGFGQSTDDWRTIVADPSIHLVDITAPNALHQEIALAAIAAGNTSTARSRSRRWRAKLGDGRGCRACRDQDSGRLQLSLQSDDCLRAGHDRRQRTR